MKINQFCIAILCMLTLLVSCSREKRAANSQEADSTEYPYQRYKETKVSDCSYLNQGSDLGVGLVLTSEAFTLYSDSLLLDKYKSIKSMHGLEYGDAPCSMFFKPDYGIMHFVCLGTTANTYRVLANATEVKYIPKQNGTFEPWERYLKSSFGIRRMHGDSIAQAQPLRSEPNELATVITLPEGHENLCVISLKGDWINIQYDCFYNQENNPHDGEPCSNYINQCPKPVTAWLKWRDGNKLLIDIFLMV